MRKESMVTRTITVTRYEIMTVNTATTTVENMTIELSGAEHKDVSKVLKRAEQLIGTENVKCVSVVSAHTITNLYGMSETNFVKYADLIKEGGR